MWRIEATAKGKKSHEWCGLYGSVRTYHHTCMRVSVDTVAYVHGFQWRQSRMYAWVLVKKVAYVQGSYDMIFWATVGLYRLTSARLTSTGTYKYWSRFVSWDLSREFC
jgi:hypothetical protein